MAICPSCFAFQDDHLETCSKCGAGLGQHGADLGLELVDSVETPRERFRPVEVLWLIMGIPIMFSLTTLGFGWVSQEQSFALKIAYPIVGGLSLGGLARMLWLRTKLHEPRDILSWWLAGGGCLLVPLALGLQRLTLSLLEREEGVNRTMFIFVVGGAHALACLPGVYSFLKDFGERRIGLASMGSVLCVLLLFSYAGMQWVAFT